MSILSPVACNVWFWSFLLVFFSSRAQSAPLHCPGGSSTQSAFKHLLFDLQNSAQKPLVFTFSDFFSFHSLGTTTDPCPVPWFCGKQAHGQGVGGLWWSTFVGWPDSGLCSQGMERGWDTGAYWIFGVTASQCSVSHLKLPLGCYIKVLQLQEPPCTKGWLSPSWWPWMGWIGLSSMDCGAIPNTHWYVITSTCCL